MAILITGGSGLIGKALTQKMLAKGEIVYSLSRHPVSKEKNLIPLQGDILEINLSLTEVPSDIEAVYHVAGVVNLSRTDKDGSIWETNAVGTENVIDFCRKKQDTASVLLFHRFF